MDRDCWELFPEGVSFPFKGPLNPPSEEHKCCLFWVQCSLKPQLWLFHKHTSFQGHSGRTLSHSIHRALRPLKRFSPTLSEVRIDLAIWTNPDLAPWLHKAKVDPTLRPINYRSPVAFFLQGKCSWQRYISPPTLHNKVIRRSTSVQQEQKPLYTVMSPQNNITENGPQQEMKQRMHMKAETPGGNKASAFKFVVGYQEGVWKKHPTLLPPLCGVSEFTRARCISSLTSVFSNLKTSYTGLFTHHLFTSLSPRPHMKLTVLRAPREQKPTGLTLLSIHARLFAVLRCLPGERELYIKKSHNGI